MTATVADTGLAPLDGYQLRLPAFEGPLDVLLRLIERSQLAITDVSLAAVTDQFLDHLAGLGAAAPETVAEFAAVGARLVLLKSRSILPRPPTADDEEAGRGDLAQQLVEYRTVKEAARHLGERDAAGTGAFAARTDGIAVPGPVAPPRLAAHHAGSLARALRRRLAVAPGPVALVPVRPGVTLREMVERVLLGLRAQPLLGFSRVSAECEDRHDVLTAFLAVLLLVRRRAVDAQQDEIFGEIVLRRVDDAPADRGVREAAEVATGRGGDIVTVPADGAPSGERPR